MSMLPPGTDVLVQPISGESMAERMHAKNAKQAALYDPDGPHPPKVRNKGNVAFDLIPAIKMLCPNVQQYSPPDSCMECGKKPSDTKLLFCSRCKMVPYCSKECQATNWSKHKKRECSTREQRVKQLRALLQKSPMRAHHFGPEALATALDIADEFVDGALIVISCTAFQTDMGQCLSKKNWFVPSASSVAFGSSGAR